MGSSYLGDHNAENHIYTDITSNISQPQQKYRLGMVSNRLFWGGRRTLNMFYYIQTLVHYFCGSKHLVSIKVSEPINESAQETNLITIKTYGESEKTRQKQRILVSGEL